MRAFILAAGAALTLAACGSSEQTENTANTMATDANMLGSENVMMDQNGMTDGAMNGNMTVDPATQNMMMQDMNTNSPDTNLANGM
jgi:hypothetical protein